MAKYKKEFKFSNGDLVEEKITGFKGIITGTVFYITGCDQYLITGKSKDGADAPSIQVDEGRIKLLEDKVFKEDEVKAKNNGSGNLIRKNTQEYVQ